MVYRLYQTASRQRGMRSRLQLSQCLCVGRAKGREERRRGETGMVGGWGHSGEHHVGSKGAKAPARGRGPRSTRVDSLFGSDTPSLHHPSSHGHMVQTKRQKVWGDSH